MKEHTHLFTKVEDGLPKENGMFVTLSNLNELMIESYDIRHKFFKQTSHWLDLSKLTTKAKAEELIKKGFKAGENYALDKYGADNMPNLPDFIAQNINKL